MIFEQFFNDIIHPERVEKNLVCFLDKSVLFLNLLFLRTLNMFGIFIFISVAIRKEHMLSIHM